jgi:hypothetical protein
MLVSVDEPLPLVMHQQPSKQMPSKLDAQVVIDCSNECMQSARSWQRFEES